MGSEAIPILTNSSGGEVVFSGREGNVSERKDWRVGLEWTVLVWVTSWGGGTRWLTCRTL